MSCQLDQSLAFLSFLQIADGQIPLPVCGIHSALLCRAFTTVAVDQRIYYIFLQSFPFITNHRVKKRRLSQSNNNRDYFLPFSFLTTSETFSHNQPSSAHIL